MSDIEIILFEDSKCRLSLFNRDVTYIVAAIEFCDIVAAMGSLWLANQALRTLFLA